MSVVTITDDGKFVIPEEIREKSGVKPGDTYEIDSIDGKIYFIPIRPLSELRGIFKGIDTNIDRDEEYCCRENCKLRV